jgi:Na+/melibiose symporter-like transporter
MMLGKFVHDAQAAGAVHLIERLEQDCRSVVSLQTLRRVMFLIACICCCFYALFLFDTLGDARGAADSYWIFLVMALFPVALYVLTRVLRARNSTGRTGGFVDDYMVEMPEVGPAQQPEEISSQEANAAASQEKSLSAGSDNNIADADSTLSALHYDP